MALMAVKIENEASILMNEFFDYHGSCYALSASRLKHGLECAALEDFYDCTIQTEYVEDTPVVFVLEGQIIGWYRKAKIYRHIQIISAFLEGNIQARSMDTVILAKAERKQLFSFDFDHKMYEIIEEDDMRYADLFDLIQKTGEGIAIRYELVDHYYSNDRLRLLQSQRGKSQDQKRKDMRDYCIERCTYYAGRLMNDACQDIRELKTMQKFAAQALIYDHDCVDALYYQAMADEQLGFIKDGLRSIEKALKLEGESDDLLAQKGHLLVAKGEYQAAIDCYEMAWNIAPEDGYLLHVGQTWFAMGNIDAAYKAYKRVQDKSLLEERGINLKDMEKRWPFVNLRGFSLKEFFGKKH